MVKPEIILTFTRTKLRSRFLMGKCLIRLIATVVIVYLVFTKI
jgi:hypothetical protein